MKNIYDLSQRMEKEALLLVLCLALCSQGCPVANCRACASATACSSCNYYYCLAGPTACWPCNAVIANCIGCSTCGNCVECAPYYAVNTFGKCQLCSWTLPRCATCYSMTACRTCTQGNYLVGASCCQVSMPYCKSCFSSPTNCDSCISNYYCKITAIECIPCNRALSNCALCSSCNACTNCINNFFAINFNQQCQPCSQLLYQC